MPAVKTPDELTALFREQGLKVTPQRQRVFRVLHESREHLSAEAVHAMASVDMPTLSLRTVYQILNDLAAMGEVQALELGTGSARFDPTLAPHHHLVCEVCGTVQDLHADFPDVRVPEGDDAGFTVSSTEIVFRGRCASCQTNQPEPKEQPIHG